MARLPLLPNDDPAPGEPVDPVTAEGMFLSSELHTVSAPEHAQRRRITTRAYQIRARRRTTPQGVFAAVAEIDIGDGEARLVLGFQRHTRSYPNPAWLHKVCDRALDNPQVLRALRFTSSNLAARRGERLQVDRPSIDALSGPDRTSVRRTEAVDAIMTVCRSGAAWNDIADALTGKWPNLPQAVVDTVMRELTRSGFLLTDLTPPDARDDPVGHVLGKLPDTEPLHRQLSRLRAALADADRCKPGEPGRLSALKQARRVCDDLTATWRPVLVDTACDAHIQIPRGLAEQAARAAGVLWRIAPEGDPLSDWHERFLMRYGTHRLVPLLDACDAVTGLGCGIGETPRPPRGETTRVLAGLLAEALAGGDLEVRLDKVMISALDQRGSSEHPEPSAELYARVIAASPGDRDAGVFTLAVSGMASPAGSTRARFTGLLPAMPDNPEAISGPMTAELVFQPAHGVAALTSRVDLAPWRIPIGTAPRDGDLLPEELAVASDGRRLFLWSARHHRTVRPVHHNQVGHHLMPPLAALLCRLGHHRTVSVSPWGWGPLEHAPFLPRVRYGDVIFSPARWRLPAALREAATDQGEWEAALSLWRNDCRPKPAGVVVADDTDRQLPLNLDRRDDRELLRRYTRRGLAAVTEPPGGPDATAAVVSGPTGHHGLEVVIPLETATPNPGPAPTPQAQPTARRQYRGLFLPGGPWLSLAIRAPQATQDSVLARIAKAAADTTAWWDRWFWLRYATDALGEHLRVRFHGTAADLGGKLLPTLNECCGKLLTERLSGGLSIEPYDQEIERYGGPEAIEAAEEVFFRDAELVAAMLTLQPDPDTRLVAVATSAAAIARTVAHGDPAALTPYRLERADRRTCARLRPVARAADDAAVPHPDLWHARHKTLAAYGDILPVSRRAGCASSLIHMHANRLLGDNHAERLARALAKDLIARKTS
jgi:thiopeptide-type bacteriocin biosynthesis protein